MDARGEKILLNKFIANQIISEEAKGDRAMQMYELAMKLNTAESEIDITESEKEIIRTVCGNGKMTVLIAAQILTIINNPK
jgi:predicted aspartyl protease